MQQQQKRDVDRAEEGRLAPLASNITSLLFHRAAFRLALPAELSFSANDTAAVPLVSVASTSTSASFTPGARAGRERRALMRRP